MNHKMSSELSLHMEGTLVTATFYFAAKIKTYFHNIHTKFHLYRIFSSIGVRSKLHVLKLFKGHS